MYITGARKPNLTFLLIYLSKIKSSVVLKTYKEKKNSSDKFRKNKKPFGNKNPELHHLDGLR